MGFTIFSLIAAALTVPLCRSHTPVVVLSFDGMRHDFVRSGIMPTLETLMDLYASPEYLKTVFPSKTLVNHFTIATGLHADKHGVINNNHFDEYGDDVHGTYDQYHYDESVVPIWIENENMGDGRYSGVMMWPGSHFKYQNKLPTHIELYDREMEYETRINKIISWIQDKERPANLVMAFFDDLYYHLCTTGIDSNETLNQLKIIDLTIHLFLIKIREINKKDDINLIIIGGRGVSSVTYDGMIHAHTFLEGIEHRYCAMCANALVAPIPEQYEEAYTILKNKSDSLRTFSVYKQNEIPNRWQLKDSNLLAGKILLVASPYYAFWKQGIHDEILKFIGEEEFVVGMDGYDNLYSSMHTFFIALGPMFKVQFTGPPFYTSDIHPLLKHLLGLTNQTSGVQIDKPMPNAVTRMLRTNPILNSSHTSINRINKEITFLY